MFTSSIKCEISHTTSLSCSHGNEMYKTAWCSAKLLFSNLNLLPFCRSRCRRRRRCLNSRVITGLDCKGFSLTWPASMQIYWNRRNRLHKKRVQLPQDWFGTPIWPPWRHVVLCDWCITNPTLGLWGLTRLVGFRFWTNLQPWDEAGYVKSFVHN